MARRTRQRGTVWHYTVGAKMEAILSSGVLLTENETSAFALQAGNKGCVWFSSNEVWEETANKGWRDGLTGKTRTLSKEETANKGSGLARIGVRMGLGIEHWLDAKHKLGLSKEQIASLERVAITRGADPRQWYVSRKPVPLSRWVSIQMFDWKEGRWIELEPCGQPEQVKG